MCLARQCISGAILRNSDIWRVAFRAALLTLAILASGTAFALEVPKAQTFPFLEEEFRALDEKAFELSSNAAFEDIWAEIEAEDGIGEDSEVVDEPPQGDLDVVLKQLREGVAAKYGPDSREMQDMYLREAQLLSLASRGQDALAPARKAVAMARRSAPAYALLHPNDPMLRLYDQIVAYQDFVSIAAKWQDAVPGLAEEAFQVAQMAELTKPALVANRRLMERGLPPGETRDLANLAGAFIDIEGPLRDSVSLAAKLGPELIEAGILDVEQVRLLTEQFNNRTATLKLIEANSDKLEAAMFPKPLTLAEIQQLLDADEAYVAFVSGESHSLTVFAVTRDAFAFHSLETVDWMKNVEEFRGLMGVGNARSAVTLAKDVALPKIDQTRLLTLGWALYSELFTEIEPLVAGKSRLLLSLHGDLMRLPFEALVTKAPEATTTFADAPWLVRSHAVTVLPTIAMLRERAEVDRSVKARFFGVGDPDYNALAGWEFSTREIQQIGELTPLPESADEVRRIGAYFDAGPDDMLIGTDATEIRLQEMSRSGKLAEYDILLFATHGLQPQELDTIFEASLALTPTKDAALLTSVFEPLALNVRTDGLYKAREIEKLRLDADLIILSACNSAADNVAELDGYSGLASAFMKAGAGTVMVSHWPVISDAAVEITTRTMGHLDGPPTGKPLALAMRAALIETIDSGGDNAHPRYWAPFSLFGAP